MEFIKRSSIVRSSLQTKPSMTQYQKETVDINKVDKEKGLYNLPKVGVCILVISVIILMNFNKLKKSFAIQFVDKHKEIM